MARHAWNRYAAVVIAWSCLSISLSARAADEFARLTDLLPRSVNAIALVDVEKAMASPLSQQEGWQKDLEKAYEAGMLRLPSGTRRLVFGADVDFDSLRSFGQAGAIQLGAPLPLKPIAASRGGETDTIEGLTVISLPEAGYLVQFDPLTLAGFSPANRKLTTTWIRDTKAKVAISPYLKKAATFSDTTGSEIILALDLYGAFSIDRVTNYLKKHAAFANRQNEVAGAAQFLASMQGVRLGIRLSNTATAAVVVDCGISPGIDSAQAKAGLLQLLSDGGMLIEDMRDWQCRVTDKEVALQGKLSSTGLRRVLSLIESPLSPEDASAHASVKTVPETTEDPRAKMAEASRKYFKSVNGMFSDLRGEMKEAANLAVTALYFDRYARRIDNLPILGVDPTVLDYSANVAAAMRRSSLLVRNMGIQGGVRSAQITSSSVGSSYAYGYRNNGYAGAAWAVPVYDAAAEMRGIDMERRKVRAEEKAAAAGDIHVLRSQVMDETAQIRRAMTEKYQVEF